MKKIILFLLPFLLISCATVGQKEVLEQKNEVPMDFPCFNFQVTAGEEIYVPVDCGFICYGDNSFSASDWDYSIPKEFGENVFLATFPYTYYFEGKKHDVFYEFLITDIDLKEEIANLELYSEIKQGTVIGTAKVDNPKISVRTVTGFDPNLILDSNRIPVEFGKYTYFDASIFMSTTPKFLTFMPVTSKKDMIEFWDYPESIEEIANSTLKYTDGKEHIGRFPTFNILVKAKLDSYPEPIRTESSTDLVLRKQFYSFCETEVTTNFDGIPFHLFFYAGFSDYLKNEYTLGDDIYLYLTSLFTKDGTIYFYARDFSIKSPEEIYDELLGNIEKIKQQSN